MVKARRQKKINKLELWTFLKLLYLHQSYFTTVIYIDRKLIYRLYKNAECLEILVFYNENISSPSSITLYPTKPLPYSPGPKWNGMLKLKNPGRYFKKIKNLP